jgi:hypothetical protein
MPAKNVISLTQTLEYSLHRQLVIQIILLISLSCAILNNSIFITYDGPDEKGHLL